MRDTSSPIVVGDRVRRYSRGPYNGSHKDEEHASFVEGVVFAIKEILLTTRVYIKVDRIVYNGKEVSVPDNYIVNPPVNGTPIVSPDFRGVDTYDGIVRIAHAEVL